MHRTGIRSLLLSTALCAVLSVSGGARADSLVRDVREIDGDVLLFAHGHILRVITARWLGYPPNDGMHFSLGTATLSILGSEREAPSIWRWNAP